MNRLDEHHNRGTHLQYSERRGGRPDNFEVATSGHAGGIMVFAAATGWGSIYLEVYEAGQRIDNQVYHNTLVQLVAWMAQEKGCRVQNLRRQDLIFQQVMYFVFL